MTDPDSIPRMREFVATITDLAFLSCYATALDGTQALPAEYKRAAQEAIRARRVQIMADMKRRGRA